MQECFLLTQKNCNGKHCSDEFCPRRYKIEKLYEMSLIPQTKWGKPTLYNDNDGTDFNEFKRLFEIESAIKEFVSKGENLFIHSSTCGNGKTSWALRLAFDYINKIWPEADLECKVLFVNVPNFLLDLKNNITNPVETVNYIKDKVKSADLVIWDDIANKIGSDYEINNLLGLIEYRTSSGKSNIYTSNLNRIELEKALGSRLASRICGLSSDIELFGKDKRAIGVTKR